MHIVALPGRRAETHAWMRDVLKAAGLPDTDIVRYRHWDADVDASVAFEAERLANRSPDLVVAKSLGTVIAATAFALHGFRPGRAVLIGTPFAALDEGDLAHLRRMGVGVDTTCIQQVADPGGAAAALSAALGVPSSHVTAVAGSDHLYSDTRELGDLIRLWID